MASYKGFLISDMKSGLELGREPWLLPKDAFVTMKNMVLFRGVLEKRLGYTQWGRISHLVEDEALGNSGATQYSGTLSNVPLEAERLTITDGTQTLTDEGDGTFSGDGTGTINYTSGAYDVTFDATTTGAVTADYYYYPGLPVMGIENFYTNSGSHQTIFFNTRRILKFDDVNDVFVDMTGGSDVFTGDDVDFFWCENWDDRLFITNNVDTIKSYDGSTLTALTTSLGDGSSVTAALLIFAYKSRLVFLRTVEGGTSYPQRARWSKPGDPDDWTNDGYVDAPTLDWIMGADFLGDDLIVWFERSVWRLRYTGNADLPFRWEQVVSTEGCYATFSIAAFSDEILAVGPTSIVACDGLDAYSIDKKVPDIVLNVDQEKFDYIYAVVIEEEQRLLLSYPKIGSDYSDESIVLNYEDNSWSIFDLAFHCYGYYSVSGERTWNDVDETWDEIEWSWDDRTLQAGYPTTLAGDRSGYIWQLSTSGADNGSAIRFEVTSGRWNPFIEDGRKARLGWIDFLVTRDPAISFDVEFFLDTETTSYMTETLTCSSDTEEEDKVWVRVYCGAVGETHQIRLSHNAANQTLKIHAIMPYFKPAGPIRGL